MNIPKFWDKKRFVLLNALKFDYILKRERVGVMRPKLLLTLLRAIPNDEDRSEEKITRSTQQRVNQLIPAMQRYVNLSGLKI